MHPRSYYLTTLTEWQRHSSRFAHSHWLALDAPVAQAFLPVQEDKSQPGGTVPSDTDAITNGVVGAPFRVPAADHTILVLVEADEGVHNSLEQNPAWETLPHPLSLKPVSENVRAALAGQGIAPGATTFDVAEAVARAHPLLRHRVF